MVWSADPKQGYLTEKGIEAMRSKLTNDIFQDELLHLYKQKDLSYQEVRKAAREAMGELIHEMESDICDCPAIEEKLIALAETFKDTRGKKVYGEAERIRLGEFTFEDEQIDDECEEEIRDFQAHWQMVNAYQEARFILSDDDAAWAEQAEAVRTLEQLWESGFTSAAHQLGKCWRDGLGVYPDDEKAELWFRRSAEAGNEFSQYALGKLLQREKRIEEAVSWYQKAAAQGNQYADYQLGKLCLRGEGVPKDVGRAIDCLTCAAESGNQYAQYALGKLYLPEDREEARYWFHESAAQGNVYAQFFLDRWDNRKRPTVMLSVTRLLRHMGEIFRDNSVPSQAPAGQQVDRQLRLKIREKKIAMGHRADDHEEYSGPSMSM